MNYKLYFITSILFCFILFTGLYLCDDNNGEDTISGNIPYKSNVYKKDKESILRKSFYKPSVVSIESIPEKLRPLFSNEGKILTYIGKLKFVNGLATDLTIDERDALYLLLGNADNDREMLHIKDRIMCKLEEQEVRPEEYESVLQSLVRETDKDGALRGYIMQHIRLAYNEPSVDNQIIIDELQWGLKYIESDVAGTALLGLAEICLNDKRVDKEELKKKALDMASNSDVFATSRLSALTVCGSLKVNESLPLMEEVLQEPSYNRVFKIVAIAQIGRLGSKKSLHLLENFENDLFYDKAIKAAIRKIKKQ